MATSAPTITIEMTDELSRQLKELGSSLRPADDDNYFFFEIVRELVISAITNYDLLVQGYRTTNDNLVAWGCRNLLELAIFTKYVLASKENALRFGRDRFIDGCDIARSLKDLELHCDPTSDTSALDDWLARMEVQGKIEGLTESKFLVTSRLAEELGMEAGFRAIDRVCSKLVHPTSWSVISMNSGMNNFPQIREALFPCGAGYLCEMFVAVKAHNARQGMRPNP